MEKLDEQRSELDITYRYEFLKNFIGFGDEDVAAIRTVLAEFAMQVPVIVGDQRKKLLAYDATARHFVVRLPGETAPLPDSLTDLAAEHGQAIKSGTVKRFYLIGGCDGTKAERSYYTEVARSASRELFEVATASRAS